MMTVRYQIAGILILLFFYTVYLRKMAVQKKQGIETNQIGKDKSNKARLRVERFLMLASYGIIVIEPISILWGYSLFRYSGKIAGIIIGLIGDAFFLLAVICMGNSWRAGVAASEHRPFVSHGVFKISRNPAFLGFDLVYLSILIMFFNWFLCVWTIFAILMLHLQILQEEKYLQEEFGDEYISYKKKVCRYFGLKSWKFWTVVFLLVMCIGFFAVNKMNENIEALPEMSFEECLQYTAKGNSDAVITVGIYKDGMMSYEVYGKDGKKLEPELHSYEIGSLSKTITAMLIRKAEMEEKLQITDTIDKYLELPDGKKYPSIAQLLTHTSGYAGYYLNPHIIWNGIVGDAPFRYVTDTEILREAAKENLTEESYDWNYSNFGYALLGMILENVYDEYYVNIVNHYLEELGMSDSRFTRDSTDLGKNWKWELRDAYAPAGAIHSNIEDMLAYAAMQLQEEDLQIMHSPLAEISIKDESYDAMNIHMDGIGYAWIVDQKNGFVWHNGGTDDYNAYLGFCKESNTAVVILSNLPGDYRIPATIWGVKLLQEISL